MTDDQSDVAPESCYPRTYALILIPAPSLPERKIRTAYHLSSEVKIQSTMNLLFKRPVYPPYEDSEQDTYSGAERAWAYIVQELQIKLPTQTTWILNQVVCWI